MKKIKSIWNHMQMALAFAAIFFAIMLVANVCIFLLMLVLFHLGIFIEFESHRLPLFIFAFISLILGTILAVAFSRLALKPLRDVMGAADRIADGDYSVRLSLSGPEEFRNLGRKFNHMAEELGSVEMLRSDFVNNFSHEFKTPIVSIRGFAKMLQLENISEEEREEYLNIIIQESERLSELSSNVLNLSHIENQTILTDKKRFNVTEQIRLAIVMMDSKWPEKGIIFQFDSDEIYINGSEELLSQVWINLLDNAIKFSPDGGNVKIALSEVGGMVQVIITNQGKPIPPEKAALVFDKFYQCDTSHATRGNGLGLSLVKQIVQLHNGQVFLKSSDEKETVFAVELPLD
ncbi:MAG: HAMP domain-containing histidine kinase [Clostridiales bacterium]|nr:HAMP domain-containing histidine kinase [Clostridiales bacterium]